MKIFDLTNMKVENKKGVIYMRNNIKNIKTSIISGIIFLAVLCLVIAIVPTGALAESIDSDNDGMSDDWELFIGLNATNPADAELDPDNDGYTNLQEFEGKSDPFDQKDIPAVTESNKNEIQSLIAIGAALAIGIAGIGSATGIGIAGAAGVAATGEKPDVFGRSLVFQILPMTQVVYGFIFAVLLLLGAGILAGEGRPEVFTQPSIGLAAIAIGLGVGLTGLSAIGQGITASASIGSYARNREVFGRGMIFTVMSETIAVFGFIIGLFILLGFGLL
jgi:V/A-type H+-transporting ATPase subunit K